MFGRVIHCRSLAWLGNPPRNGTIDAWRSIVRGHTTRRKLEENYCSFTRCIVMGVSQTPGQGRERASSTVRPYWASFLAYHSHFMTFSPHHSISLDIA